MKPLITSLKLQLPFVIAGFLSFLFSVWLYFVADEKQAGIFVGLWVPSIHSLGTLLMTSIRKPALTTVDSTSRNSNDRVGA